MKKILVTDTFYIQTDRWSYELFETTEGKDKDGNPKTYAKFVGSYSRLDTALRVINRLQVLGGDGELTLSEYVTRLEKGYKEVSDLIKGDIN